MQVTIKHKDGTEYDYEVERMPWRWRTFLVIDQGKGRLLYVPESAIEAVETVNTLAGVA